MTNEHETPSAGGHVTVGKYMVGFLLAIGLTVLSFGIIAAGIQPKYAAVVGLVLAAVVQILVHLYYFLHLDLSKELRWNFVAIVFTTLIVLIFIGGTVWIIFTLNARMM